MFVGENDIKQHSYFVFEGEKHKLALSAYESFENNLYDQRFSGNMYSRENNLHDAAESYIDEIEKTTGKRLDNPYRGAWNSFLVEDVLLGLYDEAVKNPFSAEDRKPGYFDRRQKERQAKRLKTFYKELDELKKDYPELVIKQEADLQADIMKKAEAVRQRQNLGQEENPLAAFAGQTLGWLSDPGHLTTTAITGYFTGGTGSTLLSTVGRAAVYEGAANAAQEVLSQTKVMPYKQELGFDYGLKDAAYNVAAAGAGGAVLGAAVPAVKSGLKALVTKTKTLKSKGLKLKPNEEDALAIAEHQVAIKEMVDENSPFPAGSVENMTYERRIEEAQNRLLRPFEEEALAAGWDKTAAENFGRAHDVLARLKRDNMQDIIFEQGEWSDKFGNSGSGYGMVKFVWKHGELGTDELPVMKDDIVSFPWVLDHKKPMIDDMYGDTFHWSVKRKDGVQIVYAAREIETSGGAMTMVTVHALNPDAKNKSRWLGILSPDRNDIGRLPVKRDDVWAEMVENDWDNVAGRSQSHLTKDTTQEPYYRYDESSAEASAPKSRFQGGGDVNEYSITPENLKVNPDEVVYPTTAELDEFLADKDFMLAGEDIDGNLSMKSAKEMLDEIKLEESGIDEIVDCITSYGSAKK